jgi:Fe2+ transport system protein B
LIVGMLRKELSLQLLVALAVASTGFAGAELTGLMGATAIVVYALVNTVALPCISSVAVFWRRQGALPAIAVVSASVALALLVGGIAARVLPLLGLG